MQLPVVRGVIERRLLVNFRADPGVVATILPPPFEPVVVEGFAIVGICLIRLAGLRPRFAPGSCGIRSENAAHRFAVRWNSDGREREGVYIPRRDTSSRVNALAGGRLFPGVHHRAAFEVSESGGRYDIEMRSADGVGSVSVHGRRSAALAAGSVFGTMEAASAFFARGSLGYSATRRSGVYDGLELRCREWRLEPVGVEGVRSSFFEDRTRFPEGSIEFDCALVMHEVQHEWVGRGELCGDTCGTAAGVTRSGRALRR